MPTNSVNHRWSIAAGAMRVECNLGHAEVVGDTANATACDARIGVAKTICGRARSVVKRGPYNYDPADAAAKTTIQAVVTWP